MFELGYPAVSAHHLDRSIGLQICEGLEIGVSPLQTLGLRQHNLEPLLERLFPA